jgi:outer membrane protein OmpA-like peptidoglycan-associated protein
VLLVRNKNGCIYNDSSCYLPSGKANRLIGLIHKQKWYQIGFLLLLSFPTSCFSATDSTTIHSSTNQKSFSNIVSAPKFLQITDEKTETFNSAGKTDDVVQQKKLMPVRCFVSEEEHGVEVAHFPKVSEEISGKKIEVKQIKYGQYEFVIERDKKYFIECNVIGYKNFEQSVVVSSLVVGELNTYEITLTPYKANENFILRNIYFHPNTPVFKSQSSNELAELYSYLKNNSSVMISIEGHTNSNRYIKKDNKRTQIGGEWAFHGTAKKLSKKRADEVKIFLTKKGIDASRIKTKGWGGRKELYPDATTLSDSMKNMRVEVHIIKK